MFSNGRGSYLLMASLVKSGRGHDCFYTKAGSDHPGGVRNEAITGQRRGMCSTENGLSIKE